MSCDANPVGTRPLAGKTAWIISDGKAGHEAQCLGVAAALGVAPIIKRVHPTGVFKFASPWSPVAVSEKFGTANSAFAPPWPTLAFATGRLTIPYIRALKRRAGLQTFTVILLDPRTPANSADLMWVPEHDRRRGPNVITTVTSPHAFSPARLRSLRETVPDDIAALPHPRVAVLIGGPNRDYNYTDADIDRLATALQRVAARDAGLMLTPSRRTPAAMMRAIADATSDSQRIVWDGTGENPYPMFLAHADAFIVTADSVNMACEAAATGQPIHVFTPSGTSAKFDRFHDCLRRHGATRPLLENSATRPLLENGATRPLLETDDPLETWTYRPLDSAQFIADEIVRRWSIRADVLPGLVAQS